MGRPSEVKIGLFTWRVSWGRRAVTRLVGKAGRAGGACSTEHLELAVEPLPKAGLVERSVLLHEVLHACFADSAYPMSMKEEERVVATLTNPLLSALRDNPTLVQYLLED